MCTSGCKDPVCGDGFKQAGEDCDDGNAMNNDGCVAGCKIADCGDNFVQDGAEDCDDGNEVAGDGCTSCTDDCGNGKVEAGNEEECDDNNLVGGDTCDPSCKRLAFMVFVTSMSWNGDLGGLSGADAKCNMLASAAKLPGTYMAWLSDGADAPTDRLEKSTLPYIRTDLMKVANNWMDLTTKPLLLPINRNENKGNVTSNMCNGDAQVWTNTVPVGTAKGGEHCNDWDDGGNAPSGASGWATQVDGKWTDGCSTKCDATARLYCFEQPLP
jgi:cysteine-rich repeat protein